MSKRTILTTIGTYIDQRGISTFGYQGDEVDVNDDYLEEFDRVNVENGDGKPYEAERVGVDLIGSGPAAEEEDDESKSAAKKAPAKKAT